LEGFQNGYGTDVASGTNGTIGLTALQTAKESTAVSYSGGSPSSASYKYGILSAADLATVGSTVALYGITGNGSLGAVQSYVLGTASLGTNGTLTLASNPTTAPPPVPLPAAVWLFGSGLLGLVGVSRRRKAAV
jgi:hypothetical protein